MATTEQMRALMAVACPWCGAGRGQRCVVRSRHRRGLPQHPTTLDGGCHDARWRRALDAPAAVLGESVNAKRGMPSERLVAAGSVADDDRPW